MVISRRISLALTILAAALCASQAARADFTVSIRDSVGPSNHIRVNPGDNITVYIEVASNSASDPGLVSGQFFIRDFSGNSWATVTSYSWNAGFSEDYAPDMSYGLHDGPFTSGDGADEWGATDLTFAGIGGANTTFTFLTLNLAISTSAERGQGIHLNVVDLVFGDSEFYQAATKAGFGYTVGIIPAPGAALLGAIGLMLVGRLKRRKRSLALPDSTVADE